MFNTAYVRPTSVFVNLRKCPIFFVLLVLGINIMPFINLSLLTTNFVSKLKIVHLCYFFISHAT